MAIVWKCFAQKFEKFLKRKTKKNYFFRNFYSGHSDKFLRTIPKVSAENPKRFKTFEKKVKVTKCSSGRAEGSFDNFLKFFGRKSEKFCSQNPKKFWKEKSENCFFRNFYSGHVDKNLRTMPKVSAENPKRFKTFKNYFKPQIVPLDTQKIVLTTFWRFFAGSLKKISLKIRKKIPKRKIRKLFLPKFLLWTRR